MTKEENKTKEQDEYTKIKLKVIADEAGADAETGEPMYQVHVDPIQLNKEEYRKLKQNQLTSSDDTVEVLL